MYVEGSKQNNITLPIRPTFAVWIQDVIRTWKVENLTRKNSSHSINESARNTSFAMANHHDNFDMYDSKVSAVEQRQHRAASDIIGDFAKAAHEQGLALRRQRPRAHAWSFTRLPRAPDKTGPLAGVSYDGKLMKADGKGKWWMASTRRSSTHKITRLA